MVAGPSLAGGGMNPRLVFAALCALWLAVLLSAAAAIQVKSESVRLFQELERLNAEVNAVLKSPEVAERFALLGAVPLGGSAADFEKFIRADLDKWARIVRERNIKPD